MNKKEIYEFLKKNNIWHKIIEHNAVFDMDELSKIDIPHFECVAKNLFVRDDKKRNYYLISVKENKRVDLKEFRKKNETRPLSFASEDDLKSNLNLIAGAVTPLGLLNDENLRVCFYIDKAFFEEPQLIGIHPNDNTATVFIKIEDLISIIKQHGNSVKVFEI